MDQPIINPSGFTQEPVIVPEPPKKSFPKWPIIALFAFILGITLVFAYQKLTSGSDPEVNTLPTVSSPVPLSSADPTANWKSYYSSILNYSIKYPENQKFAYVNCQDSNTSSRHFDFILSENGKSLQQQCDGQGEDYILTIIKYGGIKYECKETESWQTVQSELDVANIKSVKCEKNFVGENLYGGPAKILEIFIPGKNVSIQLYDMQYLQIFDLILSTFKFTDQDSGLVITDQELQQGWYWGDSGQKKSGTPAEWVFQEAGRSSCWHRLGTDCN